MTNMSYLAHDIQRSKKVVHAIQKTKDEKTHFSLVFVSGFKNISFTNYCHDGSCTLSQWWKIKHHIHGFLIDDKRWYPFAMYNIRSSTKACCVGLDFL